VLFRSGINWDKVHKLPPVFVPDTQSAKAYRHYFKDRYAMRDADEADIREDLDLAKSGKVGQEDASAFWSVSLENLLSSNATIAKKKRGRRHSDHSEAESPSPLAGSVRGTQ
jgi:hypothetical protein